MDKQLKIIKKLEENGWKIISCSFEGRNQIVATKRWEEISITTEECLCHGGRMWIHGEHTNTDYEISHPTYDESLGIVDSSTELDWIIENEMMDYVNKLETVIYKLVKINEWGKTNGVGQEKSTYYGNMESLCYAICEEDNIDDLFLIDEVKHQYPNPERYTITKHIYKETKYSWEKNRIWFERTEYRHKKNDAEPIVERQYEMYVDIFHKQ